MTQLTKWSWRRCSSSSRRWPPPRTESTRTPSSDVWVLWAWRPTSSPIGYSSSLIKVQLASSSFQFFFIHALTNATLIVRAHSMTDGNGTIDFSELVCGLSVLCKGTPEEKIKCMNAPLFLPPLVRRVLPLLTLRLATDAFKGYDLDGDGCTRPVFHFIAFSSAIGLLSTIRSSLHQTLTRRSCTKCSRPTSTCPWRPCEKPSR